MKVDDLLMFKFIKNIFSKENKKEEYFPLEIDLQTISYLMNDPEFKHYIGSKKGIKYKNFFIDDKDSWSFDVPKCYDIYIINPNNENDLYPIYSSWWYFKPEGNSYEYEYKNGDWDVELEACIQELIKIVSDKKENMIQKRENRDKFFNDIFKKGN